MKINCPICSKLITIHPPTDTVQCEYCGKRFKVRVEIILEEIRYEKIL